MSKWIVAAITAVMLIGLAQARIRRSARRSSALIWVEPPTRRSSCRPPNTSRAKAFRATFITGSRRFTFCRVPPVEAPDGKQIMLPTGAGNINLRDVPHAGFHVVGDTSLKLLTVHIVDKGAPLYDARRK